MPALNARYMADAQEEAFKGLTNLVETTILPSIRLYRFGSSDKFGGRKDEGLYTSPWWTPYSAYEALKKQSNFLEQSLSLTARQCSAVKLEWNNRMDVLIQVAVKQTLKAWSGNPKTQPVKDGSRYLGQMRPDKEITQLHIPGLGEDDPSGSGRKIYELAFDGRWPLLLSAR